MFKEVFWQFLEYLSILQRRPRMFKKVSAICRTFFLFWNGDPRCLRRFFGIF
jgi:hypothetical protein